MPNQSQQRVYVNFTSDEFDNIADDLFQVVGFDGVEAISELFEFNIDLISNDPNIDLKSLVGKNATLAITKDGELRNFHGIISVFKQGEEAQFDHYCYKAVLVPRLWCMSLSRQNQIHQEKRVPDIVKDEILHGDFCGGILADDIDNRMAEDYPVREYTVQYRESDLDFISRLMEHEGIYYYFDHVDGHDKLVFCDEKSKLDEVLVENTVSYVPKSGLASFDDQAIHSFNSTQTQICKEIILKDYNYRTPHLPMEGNAETGDLGYGRKYAYGDHFKDVIQGNKLAQRRAQMERCQEHTCTGTSDALFFQAGKLIQVEDHYRGSLNGEYLITRIRHMGGQALPGMSGAGLTGQAVDYQNEFEGLPCDIEFRPALRHKTPKLYGFMSAIVDGVADTDRAQIDEHGRYKLLMPFDVSGTAEGKASRWVRKAEVFGGQGTGMNFPLLKGTEVMWSCMDGDLDRPIITGVVPGTGDGLNKSMVTSANSTVNKIKTPGNIVIEMQDGQGSGSADNTGTEQQQSRSVACAAEPDRYDLLLTEQQQMNGEKGERGKKGEDGEDGTDGATGETGATGSTGASGSDGTDGMDGATGATGATGNSELTDGDKADISEDARNKWMKISVTDYDPGKNSYIRLGTSSPGDASGKSGILLCTDGDQIEKNNNEVVKSSGFSYKAAVGMSGWATVGYRSSAALALNSTLSVGGNMTASAAFDISVAGAGKVAVTKSYDHSVILPGGYKYSEVGGPITNRANTISLIAIDDTGTDSLAIAALKENQNLNRKAIIAGAAATAATYAAVLIAADDGDSTTDGAAKLTNTDVARNCLLANMGLTVATMGTGLLEAYFAKWILAEEKKKLKDTAFITVHKDSIILSCDGSSIVIHKDGVFINGKSFATGQLPDNANMFGANDGDIGNMKVNKKYPEKINLNAKEAIDMRSQDSIVFTTDSALVMDDYEADDELLIMNPMNTASRIRKEFADLPSPAGGTQIKMGIQGKGDVVLKSLGNVTLDTKDGEFKVEATTVDIDASGEAKYLGKPAHLGTTKCKLWTGVKGITVNK